MKDNKEQLHFWKIPFLIIILGIISAGLILINNHLIIYLVGYGVIYTNWLLIFVIMFLIKNSYKLLIKKDLKSWSGLLISFPIFLFLLSINEYSLHYGATVTYTKFGARELIKELILGSLGLSLFFTIVFIIIGNQLIKRKQND